MNAKILTWYEIAINNPNYPCKFVTWKYNCSTLDPEAKPVRNDTPFSITDTHQDAKNSIYDNAGSHVMGRESTDPDIVEIWMETGL